MSYILIVEDNLDNAEILEVYLESQRFPVQHAPGGYDIMNYVTKNPPALIFMDINLPDNDGRVLCHQIKQRLGENAPSIIVMTAAYGEGYEKTSRVLGADDFIKKPITHQMVMDTIKTYLPEAIADINLSE